METLTGDDSPSEHDCRNMIGTLWPIFTCRKQVECQTFASAVRREMTRIRHVFSHLKSRAATTLEPAWAGNAYQPGNLRSGRYFRVVTIMSRPQLPLFLSRQYDERMSFSETIFLFFLALIIFGPKKLPEIARQVGKVLNEFRRASNEFKAQIEQEIANLEVEKKKEVGKKEESTVLPPSPAPEGTASRALNATSVEAPEAPGAPAASPEESVSSPSTQVEKDTENTGVSAPEHVSASDPVAQSSPVTTSSALSSSSSATPPITQESHA
jgi:sec-independent protein translocase protein TatB